MTIFTVQVLAMAPTFSKILPKTRALLPTAALPSFMPTVTALRGGEVSDLIEKSYEWCVNLGAPAALVAGAGTSVAG